MADLSPLDKNNLPKPPSLKKLIGPSFILLGLGLGSGELILWPYLTSKYGLGIAWAAILGITFQFFLNMEIERYALISGESVFVGLARKSAIVFPLWFIFSTFVPWMWPGIAASSALIIANLLGLNYSSIFAVVLLLLIGVILTLGPIIYKTQEVFQKYLIYIGVPFVLILAFYLSKTSDWQALLSGIFAKGEGYLFLPAGISLATFLGAFAYSGAGGNLNLAQSFYIKEKGYGMGKFSGRITSILTGKKEDIKLTGSTFEINEKNLKRFRLWWKRINIEHFLIFWLTGATTMTLLSLLAFSTVYKQQALGSGIGFLISEAAIISQKSLSFVGIGFLLVAALMLFSTQFSILDATSRIMSENLVILNTRKFKVQNLSKYYYIFLWLQIIGGIVILLLGFDQPLALVITGAVLNAFSMFVYTGLILWLNKTNLDKSLRPNLIRTILIICAFVFYGGFSLITIIQAL
jgi:Mn2+/Fe2+ NRAMP family transporter